jgi:hypothetical protein
MYTLIVLLSRLLRCGYSENCRGISADIKQDGVALEFVDRKKRCPLAPGTRAA